MHRRIVAPVAVAALSSAAAFAAVASTGAHGLPAYTNGYQSWPKLNRKPIRGGSPAHSGIKSVYASKRRTGSTFPGGTVVVKSIARRGDTPDAPTQVAVMRKTRGRWTFVEYHLVGTRYAVLAQGQLCVSCHVQAKNRDYVFTR